MSNLKHLSVQELKQLLVEIDEYINQLINQCFAEACRPDKHSMNIIDKNKQKISGQSEKYKWVLYYLELKKSKE